MTVFTDRTPRFVDQSQTDPANDSLFLSIKMSAGELYGYSSPHKQMIVELYIAPTVTTPQPTESPVSNPNGELPDQEPSLSPDQLLGSFDSRDEAITFAKEQLMNGGQNIVETQSGQFNEYTHIEWLTLTTTAPNGESTPKTYYLVTDEGY